MRYYDQQNSTSLVYQIRKQQKEEKKESNRDSEGSYDFVYRQTGNEIVYFAINKHLINEDSIGNWLKKICENLTSANPQIDQPRTLLVKREGFVNATTYIDGTIIINLGLLASTQNEDEIAFILAHEIAHIHLSHLKSKVEKYLRKPVSRGIGSKLRKIPKGSFDLTDLEEVQFWFNSLHYHSRTDEFQADSMAFEIVKNSDYSLNNVRDVYSTLSYAYSPIYPLGKSLFDYFIFAEMPFKKRWLAPSRINHNASIVEGLVNNDSLKTHPGIEQRQKLFDEMTRGLNEAVEPPVEKEFNKVLQFELLRSFYFYRQLDLGVHHALQLLNEYGSDSYLSFQLGKMLYEIALAKNDHNLRQVASIHTDNYHPETKALNNFFYNLTIPETAELSYLFTKQNFDPENADHYLLLSKCATLTRRLDEARLLKKQFRRSFPKKHFGKYSDQE